MIEINENPEINDLKISNEFYDEIQKRERINLYFNPPIKDFQSYLFIAIGAAFVGLTLFIVSFITIIVLIIVAIILLAVSGITFYLFFHRKKIYEGKLVPESELDTLLCDDISKIKEYILDRLNLDVSQLMIETVYSSYYFHCII